MRARRTAMTRVRSARRVPESKRRVSEPRRSVPALTRPARPNSSSAPAPRERRGSPPVRARSEWPGGRSRGGRRLGAWRRSGRRRGGRARRGGAAGVGAAGGVTADTACVTGAVAGATFVTVSVAAGTTCDSGSVTGVCGAGSGSWAIAGEAATRTRMRARGRARLRGIGAIRDARTAPADLCFLVNYPSGDRPLRFPSHGLRLQVCEFRTLDANFSLKHEIALMSQFAGFLLATSGGNSDLTAQMGPEAGRFGTRGRRKQVARPGQITARE